MHFWAKPSVRDVLGLVGYPCFACLRTSHEVTGTSAARRNARSGHMRAADAASLGARQLLVVCTPWVALIAVSRVYPNISTEAQRNRETEELEHVVLKSEREETSSTPTCGSSACDSGGQHGWSGPNRRPVLSCGQLFCCSHFFLPSKLSFCLLCTPCTIRVRTSTSKLSSTWRWKNFTHVTLTVRGRSSSQSPCGALFSGGALS